MSEDLKKKISQLTESSELYGDEVFPIVQSANVTNITTTDATDLATALALVNELKTKLNAKLTADRNSGQQAT